MNEHRALLFAHTFEIENGSRPFQLKSTARGALRNVVSLMAIAFKHQRREWEESEMRRDERLTYFESRPPSDTTSLPSHFRRHSDDESFETFFVIVKTRRSITTSSLGIVCLPFFTPC